MVEKVNVRFLNPVRLEVSIFPRNSLNLVCDMEKAKVLAILHLDQRLYWFLKDQRISHLAMALIKELLLEKHFKNTKKRLYFIKAMKSSYLYFIALYFMPTNEINKVTAIVEF